MSTTLDRLSEMSEFLHALALMEEGLLLAALSEGWSEQVPEWAGDAPQAYWANRLLVTIRNASETLIERITPGDGDRVVVADVQLSPITIRPYTAEEREARRRGEGSPDNE